MIRCDSCISAYCRNLPESRIEPTWGPVIVTINFKLLKRHSKPKRRAPAYSRAFTNSILSHYVFVYVSGVVVDTAEGVVPKPCPFEGRYAIHTGTNVCSSYLRSGCPRTITSLSNRSISSSLSDTASSTVASSHLEIVSSCSTKSGTEDGEWMGERCKPSLIFFNLIFLPYFPSYFAIFLPCIYCSQFSILFMYHILLYHFPILFS